MRRTGVSRYYLHSFLVYSLAFLYKVVLFRLTGRKCAGLILDSIVSLSVKVPEKKSGLLILRFDVIGDFILWLNQAKEYRKLFPGQRIVLMGHCRWAEFASVFPYWDDVWEFDPHAFLNDPMYRIKIIARVRKAGFKTAIQPTHVRFFYGDAIIRSSCADIRIGSTGDPAHLKPIQTKTNRWYTKLVPAVERPLMMLCREAEFTRGLGNLNSRAQLPDIGAYLEPSDITDKLPEHYYVLFPGAGAKYKRWPIEKLSQLAVRLHNFTGLKCVICGGTEERELVKALRNTCSAELMDLAGQTSLNDLCVVIKQAMFIVSNDSCAIHIAAAVKTPGICVLGGGDYGRCLPYVVEQGDARFAPHVCICQMHCFGCRWKRPCMPKTKGRNSMPVPCISNITVEQVFEKVKDVVHNTRIGKKAVRPD